MSSVLGTSAVGFDYLDDYQEFVSESSGVVFSEPGEPRVNWPADRREVSFTITSGTANSSWFRDLMSDLQELLNMGENWNGYGEKAVHEASAKRVVNILDRMEYAGRSLAVVPMSNGGLQLEWHRGAKSVEVEVPPTGDASGWYFDENEDEEKEWAIGSSGGLLQLAECLDRLSNA